jgi:membrane-bound lytic murein transglycosylase D
MTIADWILRTGRAGDWLWRRGAVLAVLALVGCATSHPPAPPPAEQFAIVPPAPPPEPVAVLLRGGYLHELRGPNDTDSQAIDARDFDQAADPRAAYGDVLARMRAEYEFPPVDARAIDRQIQYLAARDEFLNRVFERAELYLYYVVVELESRHMPVELAMLPVIESAYNPYAYSRARAAGMWQFITPTATRYQVRVNWWQDGRRDVVDSTRAALDYLAVLHEEFGDWLLAVAAYNCGEAAVQRAVDYNTRHHRPTDFWHLKLPRETRGYVPSLLAMDRIVADPAAYGLAFAPIANKPYFTRVEVGTQIDLRVAAALAGVSAEELHALNPSYNRWATDPGGPFHLLVPYDRADRFTTGLALLSRDARLPLEHYRVGPGDTVATLAASHAIPPATIAMLNALGSAPLAVGEEIVLPVSDVSALRAGLIIEGETPGTFGRRHHRHARVYVVRRGDTLTTIARRTHLDVQELERLNGLDDGDSLTAGRRLLLAARAPTSHSTGHHHSKHSAHETHKQVRNSEHHGEPQALNLLPGQRVPARISDATHFGG